MRKILIIGGGGLIGQAIALEHLVNGDDVFIYDTRINLYNDYSRLVGNDISSKGNIETVIKSENFNVISHQAAHVGVGESQYSIEKYTNNNILFTSQVLQIIADNKFKKLEKFILAGSMGPYGEGPYFCQEHGKIYPSRKNSIEIHCPICSVKEIKPLHIDEKSLKVPKSIYGLTKLAQEEMTRIFSEIYGLETVSLRYFSVYGLKSNPNNPFTGVLSIIGNKIINSDKIHLYENGEQTRDLISASDIAKAHYISSIINFNNKFEAFNLGTGISTSIKDIALKMLNTMQIEKELLFNNFYRIGDIKHSQANIDKFSMLSKWKPEININDAIIDYSNYLTEHWTKYKTNVDTSETEHLNLINKGIV